MSTTKKHLKPLVAILGPTASGKTDLAIKLAKKFSAKGGPASGWKGVEIVCADSRTIYKGMIVGTAKPIGRQITKNKWRITIVKNVPHYMIDIVGPDQTFTVAQFKKQTIQIIKDIHNRGKLPFLVGGTGLYISAVVDNLEIPHVPPDKKLRKKLELRAKKYGFNYLYKKLLKLDPEAKNFVQKNNLRRIIRALEVCLKTKKPFSQMRQKGKPLFNVLQIGVKMPRQKLYQRINQRVDKMIKVGLVDEVRRLSKKYSFNCPAMSGIGYRQIGLYLKNKISLERAIELIKKDTRHYAKRQMTWFSAHGGSASLAGQAGGKRHPAPEQVRCGANKKIKWVLPANLKKVQQLIKKFI